MTDKQLINPELPLVLGGNSFGWTSDETESFEVLDAFLDAQGAHIDTADLYSAWAPGNHGGESETVLGNYFSARRNRDKVFLATKVGAWQPHQGLSQENVRAALDSSLERLQSDRVELYYAHHDDETQTAQQLARTFDRLVQEGKVGHIGMSNLSPQRQHAWIAAAKSEGLTVPVAIQPNYSLAHRSDVEAVDGYGAVAQQNNLAMFPYFSLAAGLLTGKYRTLEDFHGVDRAGMLSKYATADGLALVETLVRVADDVAAAPASVALAWLRAKGVTAPIASARIVEQLGALIAGAQLELTTDHIAQLDRASQPYR